MTRIIFYVFLSIIFNFCNLNLFDSLDPKRIVIANGGLNLRSEPNLNSKIITLLPSGSYVYIIEEKLNHTLEISGRTDHWVKVEFVENEKIVEGWVFNSYLYSYTVGYPDKPESKTWESYLKETDWVDVPQYDSKSIPISAIRFFTPAQLNSVSSRCHYLKKCTNSGTYWLEDYGRKIDLALYADGSKEKIDASCKILTLEPKFDTDYTRALNCDYETAHSKLIFYYKPYMIYFDRNSSPLQNPKPTSLWNDFKKGFLKD